MSNLTRREFIKTVSLAMLAMTVPANIFAADNCTVKTRYGTFNGFVDKQGVKTWLGIPYAQPPVGKLRWQAPQPLKPTNKTFDAKKFGASALQEDDKLEAASQNVQSEDCLTLNIWRRSDKNNQPVMVFIHGGGFQNGGSSDPLYNVTNFAAAHDVVIVTINYRLAVFGFVNFGAIDSAYEDSGYLGLKDQVAALKWVKENISAFGGNPDNITIFGESAGAISCMMLTVIPAAKGLFGKAIPQSANKFLTGTTADEWRYFLLEFENFFEHFRDNPKNFSPVMMKYTAKTPQEIYQAWLKNRPDTDENFEDFVNQSDWRVGQELTAEYQSNFGDVYYYLFSEQSPDEKLRSCHAVDLPYTFNNGDHIVPNPKQNLVKVIQSSWAAFAATGTPDNEFIPHWEKYSADNRQTMELNSKGCVCHKDLNTSNLNALRYLYED